ncbi:hypothetical protein D3C81_1407450 [compost metagenome]
MQEFEAYKKLLHSEIDRILFIDESMIRDYQALSRTWFAKGQQKIVLVLDNAKIHHAALIQLLLTEHQSVLTLLYLPPYSPKLNLIEGLWGWLKESVINNVFFDTVQKIRKAVQGFIHEINKTPEVTFDRLCVQI